MKTFFALLGWTVFLSVGAYFGLKFLEIQIGTLVDWGVGVSSLIWLFFIVTVPWDAHFRAKEVLNDAKISKRKDILVIEESLRYVEKVAKRSLVIAVSLHIVSAVGLYVVAISNVSNIGYFAAGAALLLTFLRPSVRYYEYLQQQLSIIQQEFRYPREDLRELLGKVETMMQQIEYLENTLSTDAEKKSWRQEVERAQQKIIDEIQELKKLIKETQILSESQINRINQKLSEDIQKTRQESHITLEKLTTDSKILDSVREIANFIKQIKS